MKSLLTDPHTIIKTLSYNPRSLAILGVAIVKAPVLMQLTAVGNLGKSVTFGHHRVVLW